MALNVSQVMFFVIINNLFRFNEHFIVLPARCCTNNFYSYFYPRHYSLSEIDDNLLCQMYIRKKPFLEISRNELRMKKYIKM